MTNRSTFVSFVALLLCAALSAACEKQSVVSNAPAPSAPSAAPTPAQAEPASSVPAAVATATPHTVTAATTPTPTPLPIIKQAQTQPGVPVTVPDSVRRPLTGEELQKALQQLPPEVRARIQGMGAAPKATPQPTKKP